MEPSSNPLGKYGAGDSGCSSKKKAATAAATATTAAPVKPVRESTAVAAAATAANVEAFAQSFRGRGWNGNGYEENTDLAHGDTSNCNGKHKEKAIADLLN